MNAVASVLRLNGDLAGAEALQRQGLELNRRTRGEFHANTGTSLHDLAVIVASKGDQAGAELLFRQALAVQRKALGDAHPNVATSLNGLSRTLVGQRRFDEAAAALREALAVARPALGNDHQLVAIYTINLAAVELARRQPAAAEPLIREGLRIRSAAPNLVPGRRRTFPDDDWSIGATKSLLGAALAALARYPEAEATLLEARRDLEASPRSTPRDVKTAITRLADVYAASGKRDKAAALRASLASS
jgi:tetratricopeptide (TPR) repeat protein